MTWYQPDTYHWGQLLSFLIFQPGQVLCSCLGFDLNLNLSNSVAYKKKMCKAKSNSFIGIFQGFCCIKFSSIILSPFHTCRPYLESIEAVIGMRASKMVVRDHTIIMYPEKLYVSNPTHWFNTLRNKRCDLTGIHYITFWDCYSIF